MTGTNGISSLNKLLGSLRDSDSSTVKVGAAGTATASKLDGTAQVSPQRADQTSVSAAGGLAAQAAGDSDVRLNKVAQLQAAIASGTYNVSASAVADKMMESMLGSR